MSNFERTPASAWDRICLLAGLKGLFVEEDTVHPSSDQNDQNDQNFYFLVLCDLSNYAVYPDIDCTGSLGSSLEASPGDCSLNCDGNSDCTGNV